MKPTAMDLPGLPSHLEAVVLPPQAIPECLHVVDAGFDELRGRREAVAHWFEQRVLANPWQSSLPGIGVGLRQQGELVAVRAMFAQPWWLEGMDTVVAFAAHTAVLPACQGQGLGRHLVAASRAFARVTGSTTGGNITQKLYARLGFHAVGGDDNGFLRKRVSLVGSLRSRLGPALGTSLGRLLDVGLALRRGTPRLPPGWRLEPVERCGPEFDLLWAAVRDGEHSCLRRDAAFLQWRVFERPTAALRLLALRDARGQLRAAATWAVQHYSSQVGVASLRDILCPRHEPETLAALTAALLGHWRRAGLSWASVEVSSPDLLAPFVAARFTPVASNGNRYWIAGHDTLSEATLAQWFRSGLDGDYFDIEP